MPSADLGDATSEYPELLQNFEMGVDYTRLLKARAVPIFSEKKIPDLGSSGWLNRGAWNELTVVGSFPGRA